MSRSVKGTRPHLGITQRTALLAWLIAVTTLALFVVSFVPWEKQVFIDNLRSKAYGVSVSLSEVTAGAVVNEDYSTVVDHCTEMLRRDDAIAYIVITRNDGFSLVHERSGWRSENLGAEWHPLNRVPTGDIRRVPLFQLRVYGFSQPFDYSGIQWGWIHVGLSLDAYDRSIGTLYWRTALLAIACIITGLVASVGYAKYLVRPLLELQAAVERIAGGDLTARAPLHRMDEIGRLADAFNGMAEALLRRDRTLQEANETLEQRVRDRTRELEEEVAARGRANRDLSDAQHRLMQLSREAGMAEVATGVLHNVGNVLNSVNVSATLLRDTLRSSELPQLGRTVALLEQHRHELHEFLARDPRGKLVLPFLNELNRLLEFEHARLSQEAGALSQNIEHIKEIVAMQQSFARTAAVLERIAPTDLIEHALSINHSSLDRHGCTVRREFAPGVPAITTDRHGVVQILTNFIANAVHATKSRPRGDRLVTASIERDGDHSLVFRVIDNGVGIAPENLPRLFSLGFTTRKDGHGFGLHAGALAAKTLGGRLEAASRGPGTGATFSLFLPVAPVDSQT